MLADQEDAFYYITLMNENYPQTAMPADAREGILRGMYLLRGSDSSDEKTPHVQLFGSGAILREVVAGADLLANDWNVRSDVWAVTSFNELQRDGESGFDRGERVERGVQRRGGLDHRKPCAEA